MNELRECDRCGCKFQPYAKENKTNSVAEFHLDKDVNKRELLRVFELCGRCRESFYCWMNDIKYVIK